MYRRVGSILLAVIFFIIIVVFHNPASCVTSNLEVMNTGTSLTGVVDDGAKVTLEKGYYNCQPVKRGDIVAYDYGGSDIPIIKIVKGIPRDTFSLEKEGDYWNLFINGRIVKNSKEEPYTLNKDHHRMLALYEKDYGGVIPADAYLILGNLAGGSVDSTRFGLVGKSDFLGRIRLPL